MQYLVISEHIKHEKTISTYTIAAHDWPSLVRIIPIKRKGPTPLREYWEKLESCFRGARQLLQEHLSLVKYSSESPLRQLKWLTLLERRLTKWVGFICMPYRRHKPNVHVSYQSTPWSKFAREVINSCNHVLGKSDSCCILSFIRSQCVNPPLHSNRADHPIVT